MSNKLIAELPQITDIATGDKLLITDISEAVGGQSKQVTVNQLDDRYLAFNPISIPYGEMWQVNNAIPTLMPVQGDWYKIDNFVAGENNIVTYNDSSLTTPLNLIFAVNISVTAICPANEDFNFAVFKNGVQEPKLTVFRRFDAGKEGNIGITGLISVSATDVLDLRAQQTTDSENVTVVNSNFNLIGI